MGTYSKDDLVPGAEAGAAFNSQTQRAVPYLHFENINEILIGGKHHFLRALGEYHIKGTVEPDSIERSHIERFFDLHSVSLDMLAGSGNNKITGEYRQ